MAPSHRRKYKDIVTEEVPSKDEFVRELADKREQARRDPFFLGALLGYDFQPDVHTDLFDALPAGDRKKAFFYVSANKNRLILWPRGHYKTSAVVVRIVQLILNYPDIRILIMQANLKLTKGWLLEIRSHFDGKNEKSRLPDLFPEFCGKNLGSSMAFTVPARERKHLKEATVTIASPKAVQTGQHYDIFCADDLVNSANFRNVELLDKLESEFNHFRPLLDPGGYTIVTGTRYHFVDLYGRILAKAQDWVISVRGAWDEAGKLLFPQRVARDGRHIGFTRELLDSIARTMDPESFEAQYFNRIIATGRQLFPEELILSRVRSTKDAEFPANAPCYLVVDLATGDQTKSDDSVIAVAKRESNGRTWILDCVGGHMSPFILAMTIIKLALEHRPVAVLIEKSTNSEFFFEYMRHLLREKNINLQLEPIKVKNTKGAKHMRISALESALRLNILFFTPTIQDFEKFKDEFVQYPKARHDDRPDAIALLMTYFVQNGGVSTPYLKVQAHVPYFALPHDPPPPTTPQSNGPGFGFTC